jgi:hypothetical protein
MSTPTDTPPEANTAPDKDGQGGCSAMPGSPPWTPRTKKALALALKAAKRHGCSFVGVEHILYGIAAEESHVSSMLSSAGITPASIAAIYDWQESKCFCGGNGWVMLVGTGAPNRKIACPDCVANDQGQQRARVTWHGARRCRPLAAPPGSGPF